MRTPLTCFLLAVCLAGLSPAAETPVRGGQLKVAIQAEPRSLDPALASDEPSELVRYLTAGTLLRMNRQTRKLEPELAESLTSGDGGRTLVIRLRPGIRFSNGAHLEAKDVCHTFRRILDPSVDAPLGEAFRAVRGGTNCEVRDPRTAILRFGEPIAAVERILDDIAIQSSGSNEQPGPVLGAFFLAEHQPGSFLILRRNPHYWKRDAQGVQLPYLDSIRLEVQRNRDLEMMRFRSGELHLVNNLDPLLFERLKAQSPGVARDLGVSLDTEQFWFNQVKSAPIATHKKAWFASTEFRRAVSEAINRTDMARVVYQGHATPAGGPVSPANREWANSSIQPPPGSRSGALQRLSQAGFRLDGGVLRDPTGNPVEFSIITNAGNRSRERLAAMIQDDLKKIGIRVSVAPIDFPSLIGRIMKNFDYDACLLGLVMTDLDPIAQMQVWLSSGPQHQWNPNQAKPETEWEAEIDRQMRLLATETSFAARKKAFDRVQHIVSEAAPFIYLVNRHALVAVSPGVRGADPSVLRPQTLWNADRLWLAPGVEVTRR